MERRGFRALLTGAFVLLATVGWASAFYLPGLAPVNFCKKLDYETPCKVSDDEWRWPRKANNHQLTNIIKMNQHSPTISHTLTPPINRRSKIKIIYLDDKFYKLDHLHLHTIRINFYPKIDADTILLCRYFLIGHIIKFNNRHQICYIVSFTPWF